MDKTGELVYFKSNAENASSFPLSICATILKPFGAVKLSSAFVCNAVISFQSLTGSEEKCGGNELMSTLRCQQEEEKLRYLQELEAQLADAP